MATNTAWLQLHCTTHTARRTHAQPCEHCGGPIQPGERYHDLAGINGGAFVASRFHAECPSWEAHWDQEHEADRFRWTGRAAA